MAVVLDLLLRPNENTDSLLRRARAAAGVSIRTFVPVKQVN
jgi:hypothetical protein